MDHLDLSLLTMLAELSLPVPAVRLRRPATAWIGRGRGRGPDGADPRAAPAPNADLPTGHPAGTVALADAGH